MRLAGADVPGRSGTDFVLLELVLLVVGRATGRPLDDGVGAVRVGVLVGRDVDFEDELLTG